MKKRVLTFLILFAIVLALPLFLRGGGIVYGQSDGEPPEKGRAEHLRAQHIRIDLVYKNKIFHYSDDYITPSNHLIAEELFQKRINGDYHQKLEVMNKCVAFGGTYKNAVLYTMPLFEQVVDAAIKQISRPPENSKISFDPDQKPMFRIKREINGIIVDEEGLYKSVYLALRVQCHVRVVVKTESVAPAITAEDNAAATKLRTRYFTDLGKSSNNRRDNISLALSKVNGTVLEQGEEFSFNKTVGRRTVANGFKESKIIVGGKYEDGVGGGVCQASTTIYNAALLSGLTVTSVRNHSLECTYELPSFDAMVNDGTSDLRFKNTDSSPVFLRCFVEDSKVIIEVYGSTLDYRIERKSEIIYRNDPPKAEKKVDTEYKYHDPTAESGAQKVVTYPRGEMKSAGFLLYYDKGGNLIKTVKIREDKYAKVKGLVMVAP